MYAFEKSQMREKMRRRRGQKEDDDEGDEDPEYSRPVEVCGDSDSTFQLRVNALIFSIAQMFPSNPICVHPHAERFALFWVRPNSQDAAIEVFDLHFERPAEVVWRVANFRAGLHTPLME